MKKIYIFILIFSFTSFLTSCDLDYNFEDQQAIDKDDINLIEEIWDQSLDKAIAFYRDKDSNDESETQDIDNLIEISSLDSDNSWTLETQIEQDLPNQDEIDKQEKINQLKQNILLQAEEDKKAAEAEASRLSNMEADKKAAEAEAARFAKIESAKKKANTRTRAS